MPSVQAKDNETFDMMFRRFKRICDRAGVIADVRRKQFYEKPTAVNKRKSAVAVKREQKRVNREKRKFKSLY